MTNVSNQTFCTYLKFIIPRSRDTGKTCKNKLCDKYQGTLFLAIGLKTSVKACRFYGESSCASENEFSPN